MKLASFDGNINTIIRPDFFCAELNKRNPLIVVLVLFTSLDMIV